MATPGALSEVAGAARRAAEVGFDGFFTAETGHDPFLPLAIASHVSPELTLGTGIAVAFPRSPMVIAQTSWDLQQISGGKFILGLGTQIKPHIVRRFSTEWTKPIPRLREYIGALRAIWNSFANQEPLRFSGDHYAFSLLTPFFTPEPIAQPDIPVTIAGVGPALSRLAGEVCNGFHIHPFHTVRYLDELVIPNITAGAAASGRSLEEIDRLVSLFVITGRDEKEMAAMREVVRTQIAFYASTPSYAPVLQAHGWDFGSELNQMSRRGEWIRMAGLVPDEVVDTVAVVAEPSRLSEAIRSKYGDRIQRVGFYNLGGSAPMPDELLAGVISDLSS